LATRLCGRTVQRVESSGLVHLLSTLLVQICIMLGGGNVLRVAYFCALVTVIGSVLVGGTSSARASESDGLANFSVSYVSSASTLWVEAEAPGLTSSDLVVFADGHRQPVRSTALGAASILKLSGGNVRLSLGASRVTSAHLSFTLIDDAGHIVSDADRLVELPSFVSDQAVSASGSSAVTTIEFGSSASDVTPSPWAWILPVAVWSLCGLVAVASIGAAALWLRRRGRS
jgi:hypothetical protein